MQKEWKNIIPYIIGVVTAVVVLITNISIIFRYILRSPLPWSEELVRYLFVWLIFICVAIAFNREELVDISVFTDMVKGKAANIFALFRNLLCLLFASLFAYYTWLIFRNQIKLVELSPAMELPIYLVTLGMFIGSILWL
ncbi:MAG: TRAP transporter small permease, partial [Negativicutes bacterium]